AFTFGALTFWYTRRLGADFTARQSVLAALSGIGVFLLGYSMFLTNKAIQITPTGVGNRTSIAAALGVALAAAGLSGLIARLVPRARAQSNIFAALLAAYAAGGFFVISTLSSFWIDAYATELAMANDLETHVGTLPPRT